ncbi:hypothetical protein VNI00_003911 [Paramarasmius palmivorus]|uniref:F-box domain-containing protein n=1 Tax=Paramarasmius palmivorus TaxID=297713 RepID=A0AAW0DNA5_9AGAR
MGQYWELVNLDKKQTSGHLGKFGEWFWGFDTKIVAHLQRMMLPPPDPCADGKYAERPRFNTGKVTLRDLPVELHKTIFKLLKDYTDAFCFATTSVYFWNVGKEYLVAFLTRQEDKSCWAGDRLLFYGDYADDLPPHVENAPKAEERITFNELMRKSCKWPRLSGEPPNVEDFAGREDMFEAWAVPFETLYDHDGEKIQTSEKWVLRNLVKKEYTYDDEGDIGDFAHRLAIRTLWSSYVDHVDYDPGIFAHGKWAGDRFDIVPEEHVKYVIGQDGNVVEEEGWKDVTGAMRKELDIMAENEW